MGEQLALDVAPPAAERRYTCCGAPCGPLPQPYTLGGRDDDPGRPSPGDYPHAEDCANPNIGVWIARDGRPIRRLHCIRADGSCPSGGRFVDERVADPHGGRCCIDLRKEAAAA